MTDRFVLGAPLGRWQTNCYLIGDRERGSGVIVDPGEQGERHVPEMLSQAGVSCEAILLTHGHLDHVWAVPELAADLDVPVLLHPDDRWLWDDPAAGLGLTPQLLESELGLVWQPPTDQLDAITDGQTLSLAGYALEVRHTPGHTPGSSVFLLTDTGSDDPLLLSGDLLFAGSVGRTDLPGGSWQQQLDSLASKVLVLPDATQIAPGHGPETTLGQERVSNPYLTEIA